MRALKIVSLIYHVLLLQTCYRLFVPAPNWGGGASAPQPPCLRPILKIFWIHPCEIPAGENPEHAYDCERWLFANSVGTLSSTILASTLGVFTLHWGGNRLNPRRCPNVFIIRRGGRDFHNHLWFTFCPPGGGHPSIYKWYKNSENCTLT